MNQTSYPGKKPWLARESQKVAISVLLPVYNGAATLKACLTSVLNQSEEDFELIVVDDGSSDATRPIIAHFAAGDSRVRLIPLRENRGIVAALNTGLAHCRGRWIARMDADDRMRPHRLHRQKAFMLAQPELDLIGTQIQIFRESGDIRPGQKNYQDWSNALTSHEAIQQALWLESPIMHPSFYAKKSLYRRLGGYRQNPWPEDYDFLWRTSLAGAKFGKVPEILLDKGDYPNRLYHTDPRCKPQAMLRAKAHFLVRSKLLPRDRPVILAGTGPSGRAVMLGLEEEGIEVAGFTDTKQGPPGRTVCGLPAHRLKPDGSCTWFASAPLPFFLLCIADPDGRTLYETAFLRHGLRANKDYQRLM